MREIKFRAKSISRNEWVYGLVYTVRVGQDSNEVTWRLSKSINGAHTKIDPKTVGQYTCLKDKNGKEIYEGDIVNWNAEDFNMSIIFHEGTFLAIASSSVYEPGNRLFYPRSQHGSPEWSEFVILGNKSEGINRALIESNDL